MRQRKVKNEQEKLDSHARYMPKSPREYKGRWHEAFENQNELYLECGCGKGRFIAAQASLHPDRNYVGAEGQGSVILRALEKAEEQQADNLLFMHAFIGDVRDYFAPGELAGIYLNFSDPWPKMRHESRRLTSRRYLEGYAQVLKAGGCIECKTDNSGLFAFTLKSFEGFGMQIIQQTDNLHSSPLTAKEVMSEYEERFKRFGRKIYYCKAKF